MLGKLLTSLLVAGLCLTASNSVSATKVQTKRFVVGEEKTETPQEADPSFQVPTSTGVDVEDSSDVGQADEPPPILRDLSLLPAAVRETREKLLAAARSGDIEKLRPLLAKGEDATNLTFGGIDGDPIAFLKESSGDPEGHELLAILIEILEAGFVKFDAGTEQEMYVWPYFFAWPIDRLTPPMRVELFRILTAGDLEDSESIGSYIFYRLGVRSDGSWAFFLAGD